VGFLFFSPDPVQKKQTGRVEKGLVGERGLPPAAGGGLAASIAAAAAKRKGKAEESYDQTEDLLD
jgi:hypothetical protein